MEEQNDPYAQYWDVHPDAASSRLAYCYELGADRLRSDLPFVYRYEEMLRPYAIFLLKRMLSLEAEERPTSEEVMAFLDGYRLERDCFMTNEYESLAFVEEDSLPSEEQEL